MSDPLTRVHRPVGRPRLCEELTLPVTVRLPQPVHDKLMTMAHDRGETASSLLRSIVVLQLK